MRAAGGQVIFAGCWRVQGDLALAPSETATSASACRRPGSPLAARARRRVPVLASDGLWDVVDGVQCGKVLLRAKDPLEGARALEPRLDGQHHRARRRARPPRLSPAAPPL